MIKREGLFVRQHPLGWVPGVGEVELQLRQRLAVSLSLGTALAKPFAQLIAFVLVRLRHSK